MQIIWSLLAQDDLAGIRTYIGKDNPVAAIRVSKKILTTAKNLRTTPAMGSWNEATQERRFVIPGLPYFISYSLDRDKGILIISRIFHTARMWQEPN